MLIDNYKLKVFRDLANPNAPRVLKTHTLYKMASKYRPNISSPTVLSLADWLQGLDAIRKVSRGLYINLRLGAVPQEAVSRLRTGAVVSLSTVLGESGCLNNYTPDIHCIIPQPRGDNQSLRATRLLGEYDHDNSGSRNDIRVTFRGIPLEVFFAPRREDVLDQSKAYPCASPEAALIHWLYLGQSPRSGLTMPPAGDIDLSYLDRRKLRRIAKSMHLEEALDQWMEKSIKAFSEPPVSARLGF